MIRIIESPDFSLNSTKRNSFQFGFLLFLLFLVNTRLSAAKATEQKRPTGLMTELLTQPNKTTLTTPHPVLAWIVPLTHQGDFQTAYQILVASSQEKLSENRADMWNSGKVISHRSINVRYAGHPLQSDHTYYWEVRTWNSQNESSAFSKPQKFKTGTLSDTFHIAHEPVVTTPVEPVRIVRQNKGNYFIDFGKDAYSWLRLTIDAPSKKKLIVRFGEKASGNSVDQHPGGTIRYADTTVVLMPGLHTYNIHTSPNYRNTHGSAVPVPDHLGVILPFRYVGIEGIPGNLKKSMLRQMTVHEPFNEEASYFKSTDATLNAVWNLCKYSIKATSAFGYYVDGDRERTPYEADAYIDQLGDYCTARSYYMARRTGQYLLAHPTWPTEWKFHSIFIAYADYMYTGNKDALRHDYNILQTKLLQKYARSDGLLDTHRLRDIVDWPPHERDGYVMKPVNTVVNAFYYQSLLDMAGIAHAIGKIQDANRYREQARQLKKVFNQKLFDTQTGLYVDGLGTMHSADHANFFPLSFGLVPKARQARIVKFLDSKGMAPSVYGAQYLLEALYKADAGNEALKLLTSHSIRSWYNMIRVGSTITMEAWDIKFKNNLDWNHAWGAAPANIIPRYLMGVRPLEPGYSKALINPEPDTLEKASGKFPTIRGPIMVSFVNHPGHMFKLTCRIPANMTARVGLPDLGAKSDILLVDGKTHHGKILNNRVYIDLPAGHYVILRTNKLK